MTMTLQAARGERSDRIGSRRVLIIGGGAIGRALRERLEAAGGYQIAVWSRVRGADTGGHRAVHCLDEARAFAPRLAVECASQAAVRSLVPALLADGVPVVLASVGALADGETHEALRAAAGPGARVILPTGAIGGLDYLDAVAHEAELEVDYVSTKPVGAWREELHRLGVDADALDEPYTLFEGSAAEAARRYPRNLNVAATLALHGAGMERTRVTVRADPHVLANLHEVRVRSAVGSASFRFQNLPSEDNPKTSALTTLSLAAEVARFFRGAA